MDVMEDFSHVGEPSNSSDTGNSTATSTHFSNMPIFVIPTMTMYGLFSFIGTIANLVVILTVIVNKRLHTLTNVFIAQLAVGDLIILVFCMPFTVTAAYYFKYWYFGKFMCFLVAFSGCAGATVTVLMLTVMSYERYVHLLKPLEARATWRRKKVIIISILVYVVSFGRSILRPLIVSTYILRRNPITGEERYQCIMVPGEPFIFWYNLTGTVMFYGLNVITVILLYIQVARHLKSPACEQMMKNSPTIMAQRARVVRMLTIMAASFITCWFMINSVGLMFLTPQMKTFSKQNWFVVYVFVSRIFEYGNCTINPLLYSFLSLSFRKAFIESWKNVLPCLKHYSELDSDASKSFNSSASIYGSRKTLVSSISADEDSRGKI